MLVDTHLHLINEGYDIDEVIKKANDNGVKKLIVSGSDLSDNFLNLESIKKDFGMKAEKKNDRLEKILKKAEAAREEKKACEGDECKDGEDCKKKECGDKECGDKDQRRAEANKRLMQRAKERREAMRRGECGKREGEKCRVGNLRRKENRAEGCDGKECDRRAEMKRAEARREAIRNARERAEAKRRMERLEARREARREEMKEAMKRRAIRRRIAESREESSKQNKHESLVNRIRNARKYR